MIEVSVEELFEAAHVNVVHFDPKVNTETSSLLGKLKDVKMEHLTKIQQQRKEMAALTKELIGGSLEESNDAAVVVGGATKGGRRKKLSRAELDLSVILPEGKRTPKPTIHPIGQPTPLKRQLKVASKTSSEKKLAKGDEQKLAKALQKIATQVALNIT